PRPFAPKIREVLDNGEAELVVGATKVEATLLLGRNPSVFTDPPRDLPTLQADQVVLAVNDTPVDARGRRPHYDIPHVHRQIKRLVGKEATWAPIGPRIRQELVRHAAAVPLLPWDWENVIDASEWHIRRKGFVTDRPVIGRHAGGHWSKWPHRARDILAAYPNDPGYRVHVLGGVEAPAEILGGVPSNWTVYPFGAMPAREFLAGIDFFVYSHHRGLVEAFGRVVLEALAAGAVAIVPRYMEPLFGDTCYYGGPADVRQYVDELYGDWGAYADRSHAATELVQKRFSYDTHVERVANLIGEPTTVPPDAHVPPPTQPGTLVVDLSGGGDKLNQMVSSIIRATVSVEGPRIVALPAERAARAGGRVAVETFPRVLDDMHPADRRRYLRMRVAGLVQEHRPARLIVIDDGHAAVRDALADVSTVETSGWHVRPGGSSDPAEDALAGQLAAILPAGWGISRLAAAGGPTPPARTVPAMPASNDLVARAGRRLRRWARGRAYAARRALLRWVQGQAGASGLLLMELDETDAGLPVRASTTHPHPDQLPVSLVVVTDVYAEPESGVRAIAERQQVTGTFRTAILAPPEWEPVASAAGFTVETMLPRPVWTTLYGTGWPGYVRRRVDEVCRAIGPSTVVFADGGLGGSEQADAALDVLEAARVRRRMGT
ncbi:MAG: glycosyltransferase, partial [Actinomycetota bacterium]